PATWRPVVTNLQLLRPAPKSGTQTDEVNESQPLESRPQWGTGSNHLEGRSVPRRVRGSRGGDEAVYLLRAFRDGRGARRVGRGGLDARNRDLQNTGCR